MSVVTASISIAAPPHRVWEMVMDPQSLSRWVTIHRRLIGSDRGAPRKGFKMDQQIHLRGVTLDVHWQLSECDEDHRAVWEGRGPARSRAHTEYLLTAQEGGTRFDYRNEFRAPLGPVGAIVSRALVGGIPEREANRTLALLKDTLEEQEKPAENV
jgi:uncharacterized protein YndB with AHSA1/START domain